MCAALRYAGHSAAQVAICAERHCMTDYWHATSRSYRAGTIRTPWATHPRACLYLADDCSFLVSDSTQRCLRSADVPTCVVPRTLSSYGDRTFAAAGPRLWNSLLVELRNPDITHGLFRQQLKRHLFQEAWTRRSVTSDMRRLRKTLTYLLTFYDMHFRCLRNHTL